MQMKRNGSLIIAAFTMVVCLLNAAAMAELQILLPLDRTAYQTNERIDVAVVRSSNAALEANDMTVTLTGEGGSKLTFVLPVGAVALAGDTARRTEHLYLNGWLLRPGRYTLEVGVDGAAASTEIDIRSHVRKSSFKLIAWGSTADKGEQVAMGEDSLGFNLLYALAEGDGSVLGGVDWMQCCSIGGGHQLNLRLECDWSDPYAIRGGAAFASRNAFYHRRQSNAIGVHLYDEPGLTWWQHPETGEWTPHDIPAQRRAYQSAFGKEPLKYKEVDGKNPEDVKRWMHWGKWKLSFMEANWKLDRFGIEYINPRLISATQSQYGWSAFTDGYYFNIARQLPVVSGHGGYSNFWMGYFNPSFFLEMARARDLTKRCWYLPTWFRMPSEQFRLEQYLSFITNIQGMATPPWITVHHPTSVDASDGIVESNKLMGKLGTIFTTMPVTRPPVAMLYSMSHNLYMQSQNTMDLNGSGHVAKQQFVYLAGKLLHTPFLPIVDEDVADGTLAACHKAVVLAGVNYLAPEVLAGLEAFAADGGVVLLTGDCQVRVKGAIKLKARAEYYNKDAVDAARAANDYAKVQALTHVGELSKSAMILAREIKPYLARAGIKPVFDCDNPGITAHRQAEGDIEYLFAVNSTFDENLNTWNAFRSATATIGLPADGRPVYDPILSRPITEFRRDGDMLKATLRFGPGQMRVFARTARPIGGVAALTPAVTIDYTANEKPIRVEIGASLLDNAGAVLSGSAPLHIEVVDPLGQTRYDLYRATKLGTFRDSFQLAANDPAGEWTVLVTELLSGTQDSAAFTYTPAPRCGAIAGTARRAIHFGLDREHIYRFFRLHRNLTIVKGSSDFNYAAAEWLATALEPWDVKCTIVNAADVNRPRPISEEEAKTWSGIGHTGRGAVKPGDQNNPIYVGFDINKPVVLLGSPEDNPLIDFLQKNRFLPYTAVKDTFPGRGRGWLAWTRDGIYREQEAIVLIAHDSEGMAEAVGTMYEAATGLEPLTPWELPRTNSIAAATRADQLPEASVAWQAVLPDRAAAMKVIGNRLAVLGEDGTLAMLDAAGKFAWQKQIDGGRIWLLDSSADGGLIVVGASHHVLGFGANGQALFDSAPTDDKAVAALDLAVSPDGSRVVVAASNGKLTALDRSGKRLWTKPALLDAKQNPIPYRSVAFTADGSKLLALKDNGADIINPADGSDTGDVAGVSGRFKPVATPQGLILTNGKNTAIVLAADGSVASKMSLPGNVSFVATAPDGLLVGTEAEGQKNQKHSVLRLIKHLAGKVDEQTAWTRLLPNRIPKHAAYGPSLAVAYWGGDVYLLTVDGQERTLNTMPQDVAKMAWLGGNLVASLADGRIIALAQR